MRYKYPSEWKISLLDDVTDRGSGHTPSQSNSEYWNGGIKWVSLADSSKLDNLFIANTDKEISVLGLQNSSAVKHPAGTVILSRDAGIGKSAILKEEMAVSQHFIVWRCLPKEIIYNVYLYYWLQLMKPEFERMAVGSTIKTIGLPYFKKLKIAYPPIKEQRKIAEIISTWDKAIALLEQIITAKRKLKQGLMQQLLTGKKRFKEFEEGKWKSCSFSEIARLRSKKFDPKTNSESKVCIELEHISQISGQLLGSIDSSKQSSTKNYFCIGDVLFGKLRPYLKKYWLAQFEGVCSTEIWVLVSQKPIIFNYLFYLVQTSEFIAVSNVSTGSKMPRADWDYVSEVSFLLPSIQEQQKIASILSTADTEISNLEKQLAAYKKQKRGLMQQLLTGKKRVKLDEPQMQKV